jgi:hypothetical protein
MKTLNVADLVTDYSAPTVTMVIPLIFSIHTAGEATKVGGAGYAVIDLRKSLGYELTMHSNNSLLDSEWGTWHSLYLDSLEETSEALQALERSQYHNARLTTLLAENDTDPLIVCENVWGGTMKRYSDWETAADRYDAITDLAKLPRVKRPWRPLYERWRKENQPLWNSVEL